MCWTPCLTQQLRLARGVWRTDYKTLKSKSCVFIRQVRVRLKKTGAEIWYEILPGSLRMQICLLESSKKRWELLGLVGKKENKRKRIRLKPVSHRFLSNTEFIGQSPVKGCRTTEYEQESIISLFLRKAWTLIVAMRAGEVRVCLAIPSSPSPSKFLEISHLHLPQVLPAAPITPTLLHLPWPFLLCAARYAWRLCFSSYPWRATDP